METRFSRESVDLPGCSFCCGSSIAANSARAGVVKMECPQPAFLRARTNDLDQTEHRHITGDGGTATYISGRRVVHRGVVGALELDRRDVSVRSVEPVVVEPPHPVGGGQLQVVHASERAVVAHALGLYRPTTDSARALSKPLSG